MKPKGKVPSLLSGRAGKVEFPIAGKKRSCSRCSKYIVKGECCITVKVPGGFSGGNTYCKDCFEEVLGQTERELSILKETFMGIS